ncbi:MAG TPA: hypothetical protein PL188_10935 [Candidatus Cloacimonadota bacterium]|nr:hypothetical protein [Candidatus Cloacimonadota bacterium]
MDNNPMELFCAYDHLLNEVRALFSITSEEGESLCQVGIMDNLVEKPAMYPCIVVEMDGSRLAAYGGGSQYTGEHEFSLWVLCQWQGSFRTARIEMAGIVDKLLSISRFYTGDAVEYGVDTVHGTRCIVARIPGKVA